MKFAVNFTAEQLVENWDKFISIIDEHISSPRKEKLISLYEEIKDHAITAPAAISNYNHNCFPGGYVDHIIRVVNCCIKLNDIWQFEGGHQNFTIEEMVFSAINHDLGKLGLPGTDGNIPNDNDWEIEKLQKYYKFNTVLPYSTVPDRTLFILQSRSIEVSSNEFLAIKLHDGLYEEANKSYLIGYQLESRLRTYLPLVLHQADLMAARVEWERQWPDLVKNNEIVKPKIESKKPPMQNRAKALKTVKATPEMMNILKNL